jgi:hypothetical protein
MRPPGPVPVVSVDSRRKLPVMLFTMVEGFPRPPPGCRGTLHGGRRVALASGLEASIQLPQTDVQGPSGWFIPAHRQQPEAGPEARAP